MASRPQHRAREGSPRFAWRRPSRACLRYRLAGMAGTPAALSLRVNPDGIAGVLTAAMAPTADAHAYW
jgi:hypothetical protein